MRFALGVDDDLGAFYAEFADDPLIGRSLRSRPWLRVRRRPEPFEALAWAICEQLIEYERAAAIQRRLVTRLGRRWTGREGGMGRLHDLPTANEAEPDGAGVDRVVRSRGGARDHIEEGCARWRGGV